MDHPPYLMILSALMSSTSCGQLFVVCKMLEERKICPPGRINTEDESFKYLYNNYAYERYPI